MKKISAGKIQPPPGYVSLGIGGSFEVTKEFFKGIVRSVGSASWDNEEAFWAGNSKAYEYAAKANSSIAKLNSDKKVKKATKKQALKTQAKPCKASQPKAVIQMPEEDILEEALRITKGDRQAQYGPPDQDFTRTANMWSALFADKLSAPFEARDVAMAMILLKLSRETHKRKRDSAVDIAGYARCLHICNEADELRQQKQ